MYAVVRSGARQYRAEEGGMLLVERLSAKPGDKVELKEVLLVADGKKVTVGQPVVKGAKVVTTVVAQELGSKIRIFKYRPRKRYRRRAGHRQHYTRLRVEKIVA